MEDMNKMKALLNSEPEKRVGEQVGNYRLIGWLGRGAFADVYLSEHLYLKRQSAIKMLHVHLPEKAVKAFLNEACTIARLDHPHIMQVLDYGVENGTPFLVMVYAPKGSLRQRFPEGMRVPLEQIIPLVQQMASALDYAHQHRLIHRDVKPENILLGAQDQALLSDFGLVLVAQSMHTQAATAMIGTILYMAPEMVEGKVHFASDQYALGIMTYEWVCGQCPFTGFTIQVGTQHMLVLPPSLCEQVPGLPPAVEHVVFKALAKDRAQRYESVTAFANALQDACKDAPSRDTNGLTVLSSSPSFKTSPQSAEALLEPAEALTFPVPIKSLQPSRGKRALITGVFTIIVVAIGIISTMVASVFASHSSSPPPVAVATPALTPSPTPTPTPTPTMIASVFASHLSPPPPVATPSPTPTPTPSPPSVLITSPTNGSQVARTTTVQGTAFNIPNGKEVWILITVDGVNAYFPQPGPVEVGNDGSWSVGITVGTDHDSGKKFELHVALADKNGRVAIDKYFMQTPSPDYVGLTSLQGIQLMRHISVIRT